MLNHQEKLLFNTVRKLVLKTQRQCHLTGIEPDELIQVGCMACLEAKTPTSQIQEVAKKAILRYYYQEYNLQKKKQNHIKIGKNDEKKVKTLVEDVIAAPVPETVEERQKRDAQQGLEWSDLLDTLPTDLKHDILIYRDKGLKGVTETHAWKSLAYKYRKQTVDYCNGVINKTSWVLKQELDRALKAKIAHPRRPFCRYLLRHAQMETTRETLEIARLSFNCPLIRRQLNKIDPRFETFFPGKELTLEEKRRAGAIYNRNYYKQTAIILQAHGIVINDFTRRLVRQKCPLIQLVIEKGFLLKAYPELCNKFKPLKPLTYMAKKEITMVKGSEEEEHKVCSEEPSVTF